MIQKILDNYAQHKIAAGLAAALGTAVIGTAAQADEERTAFGAVELLVGQDSGTLDAKVLVPTGEDLTLLSRNRVTGTYEDGSVGSFSVNSLAYGLGEGLAVFGEVDAAPAAGLLPRAGMQHFYAGDGFTLFNLLSVPVDGSDIDVLHIGKVTYATPVTEELDLRLAAETLTSVNAEGLGFATQRLRFGVGSGPYQVGVAADLSENSTSEVSGNAGGDVTINF